jgi:hypothetical protein
MVSVNSSLALLIIVCGTLRYVIFMIYIISNFKSCEQEDMRIFGTDIYGFNI